VHFEVKIKTHPITIRYTIFTCAKKLTNSHLSLSNVPNKKSNEGAKNKKRDAQKKRSSHKVHVDKTSNEGIATYNFDFYHIYGNNYEDSCSCKIVLSLLRHISSRTEQITKVLTVKAKFHYAILVADRSEAGRRPAASSNLAYHQQRASTS